MAGYLLFGVLVQHCIINSEFCEVVLDSLTVWFLNLDSDRVEH